MTAMLDQLEHAGMIERRRSDQDRRQVIVSLTDAGHETLAAKRAKIEARTAEGQGPGATGSDASQRRRSSRSAVRVDALARRTSSTGSPASRVTRPPHGGRTVPSRGPAANLLRPSAALGPGSSF